MSIPSRETSHKQGRQESLSPETGGGWFRVANDALSRLATVGPLAMCVYLVLARYANDRGECWPGVPLIARTCGKDARSIQRALRTLEAAGMIAISVRVDSRRQTSNLYTIPPIDPVTQMSPGDTSVTVPGDTSVTGGVTPVSPQDKDLIERNKKEEERADTSAAPSQLCLLATAWNDNCPADRRISMPPSARLQAAWARISNIPEVRDALADLPRLGAAIRDAAWAREQPWFRFESLFSRDNEKLRWKVHKLLAGEYAADHSQRSAPVPVAPPRRKAERDPVTEEIGREMAKRRKRREAEQAAAQAQVARQEDDPEMMSFAAIVAARQAEISAASMSA